MGLLDMVIQLCCTTSYSPLYIKGVVKYTLYKRIQDLGRDNRYFRCQNRWYDDDFRGSTDTDTGG